MAALLWFFSACSTDLIDQVGGNDGAGLKNGAVSTVVWKGDADKAVSQNIDAVKNDTRKNASGVKIPSNAHSADFPGIYFIWDAKQKDNGYLKVAAEVFDVYESFVLTSKESNTFWDFKIAVQPGQAKTPDNCYVFFIPKVYNNKNINMVFLSEWQGKTIPPEDDTPVITDTPVVKGKISFVKTVEDADGKVVDWTDWDAFSFDLYNGDDVIMTGVKAVNGIVTFESEKIIPGQKYTVKETVSGELFEVASAEEFAANQTITFNSSERPSDAKIVDPSDSWNINGLPIKAFWESQMQNKDDLAAMMAITVNGVAPTWIWDRATSWDYGVTGSESIVYINNVNIDGTIVDDHVWLYFAADNAAVVFVNGKMAGYTEKSFNATGIVPGDNYKFSSFSDNDFGDLIEHWSHVYKIDIKDFLKSGSNVIKITAANNDACVSEAYPQGKYDQTNNPAGLIFACKFEVAKGGGNNQFVNKLKPAAKGSIKATANLQETVTTQHHDPVYKVEAGTREGTLVTLSSTPFGNGQTYIKAAAGKQQIADSSPNNRPIDFFYTVEEREDGFYIVLDERITSASIGAVGFDAVPSQQDFRAPSHSTVSHVYGPIKTMVSSGNQDNQPAYTGDGYLYVHFQSISWSYQTDEIVGCKLASVDKDTHTLENATPIFVVRNEGGEEMTTTTDLPLGKYTVELWVGSEKITETTVELTETEKDITVDFGDVVVAQSCVVDNCPNKDNCPGCLPE